MAIERELLKQALNALSYVSLDVITDDMKEDIRSVRNQIKEELAKPETSIVVLPS